MGTIYRKRSKAHREEVELLRIAKNKQHKMKINLRRAYTFAYGVRSSGWNRQSLDAIDYKSALRSRDILVKCFYCKATDYNRLHIEEKKNSPLT